jgi:cob(I)alamin adenosyltransferase
MKIYTRTGDRGETGLFGGARVPKDDVRVEAYGTVDELNAVLGLCRSFGPVPIVDRVLEELQADLFTLGAELATVSGHEAKLGIELLGDADVTRLESTIDDCEATLPPLKNFVLPGGPPEVAALHLARTVARRAERRLLTLARGAPGAPDAARLPQSPRRLAFRARAPGAARKGPERRALGSQGQARVMPALFGLRCAAWPSGRLRKWENLSCVGSPARSPSVSSRPLPSKP